MIKRTLYFGHPAYLSLQQKQLLIRVPEAEKAEGLPEFLKAELRKTVPIEDIGVLIVDHPQITLSSGLMGALLENNVALVTCADNHLPIGLFLNLEGNTLQSERFFDQIQASQPLKKQLWQQTVQQKILNQAALLKENAIDFQKMCYWADSVKSGDPDNYEARAAAYYWSVVFPHFPDFTRGRYEAYPNALLNYAYAILRAVIARSLVGSGLLPTLGIHHRNKYNAYCLADDIMEPYRPFADRLVLQWVANHPGEEEGLSVELKRHLLSLPTLDVILAGERSPLMVATQRTSASLQRCFSGESRKILYPEF